MQSNINRPVDGIPQNVISKILVAGNQYWYRFAFTAYVMTAAAAAATGGAC